MMSQANNTSMRTRCSFNMVEEEEDDLVYVYIVCAWITTYDMRPIICVGKSKHHIFNKRQPRIKKV